MEDYKMRYEEALERARKLYNEAKANEYTSDMEDYEAIFPELKESEDERIRKAISIYLDWLDGRKDYAPRGEYSIRDMVVWLEKQGEKDKFIKELGEFKVKYTQEILEKYINSKNDERLRKITIAFLKDFAEQGYENAVECIDWLEKQEPVDKIGIIASTSEGAITLL